MKIEIIGIKTSGDSRYKSLLRDCYSYAKRSHHPSTHNAALLVKKNKVVLRGVNNLPEGVKQIKKRFEGQNKHIYLNHAERDVIYKAAEKGIKTGGLTMVMPWLPCIPCANAIISSGINKLIVHKQMVERTDKRWEKELINAVRIMKEAGVKIVAYDSRIGVSAYMNGRKWNA